MRSVPRNPDRPVPMPGLPGWKKARRRTSSFWTTEAAASIWQKMKSGKRTGRASGNFWRQGWERNGSRRIIRKSSYGGDPGLQSVSPEMMSGTGKRRKWWRKAGIPRNCWDGNWRQRRRLGRPCTLSEEIFVFFDLRRHGGGALRRFVSGSGNASVYQAERGDGGRRA